MWDGLGLPHLQDRTVVSWLPPPSGGELQHITGVQTLSGHSLRLLSPPGDLQPPPCYGAELHKEAGIAEPLPVRWDRSVRQGVLRVD